MSIYTDVHNKLCLIPHLNLTPYLPKVPLDDLLTELSQFKNEDFYSYDSGSVNTVMKEYMAKNWQGMCIIDACREGKNFVDYFTTENNFEKLNFNFDSRGIPVYGPTDVGDLVPSMINYIYSFANKPGKTRISRIMPGGGNATWHSHKILAMAGDKRFTTSRYNETVVIHIPLVTNDKSYMSVTDKNPLKNKECNYYKRRYRPGEVWLFNSYHFHNAFNYGDTPRDHILLYMPYYDKKLFPLLSNAVEEYTGILMSPELDLS